MKHQKHWRKTAVHSTSLIAVVLLLLIMFTSAAWFVMFPHGTSPETTPGFEQRLRQNVERWDNNRPASYRYVVQRSCDCPPVDQRPFIATEERGQKTARFLVQVESSSGEFLDEPPRPVWISDIFNELRLSAPNARDIDAQFHARYGFPESATIDLGPARTPVQYTIRDFEVLEYQ
ncbi:MAG: DUF6174 domain-containing protein [Woeseiaceae bacterium]|nr:DUF6174 domain-containing protein [Woeseiaceae bacterium]